MNMEYCPESWLDASQVVERLHVATGLRVGCRALLKLCQAEVCRVYIDCSFAPGVVSSDQLFVRRIRGAAHCELLDVADADVSIAESGGAQLLTVSGGVVVRGSARVYSSEEPRPCREEGIWRLTLGGVPRVLHFSPADVEGLVERIREGERQLQARRASA